jgi:hypothetical protein
MERDMWARRLLGALVTGAAAVSALVACGGSSEGTVVAKTDQGMYDIGCQAGGTMTGPVAVPVWGVCSAPACWRLVVRDSDGNTAEPCVSREEYDRTRLGAFWHERTDEPPGRSFVAL